jgi:NitT/TauT family transport system permease protein
MSGTDTALQQTSAGRRLRSPFKDGKAALLAVVIFVMVFGGWEIAVRLFRIPPLILPPPSKIIASLADDLISGQLLPHIMDTALEVLGGFLVGSGTGLFLGCVIGRYPLLHKTLYPYIVAFQAVPKVAIAPLIVIWFGFGLSSKIVTSATICFFPVIANALVGLRVTPPDQVEMMTAFMATRSQIFWKARLPHALPYMFAGLDIGIVLALIGAIVGEFVGAEGGLGYVILQRQFSMDITGVFAVLVILSVMGIVLHELMQWLQRRVVFWLTEADDHLVGW